MSFRSQTAFDLEALRQSFRGIVDRLTPNIANHPRRVAGSLDLEGRELRYVDLHSVYWQARQIFIDRLYDVEISTDNPFIVDCGAHIGLATLFFGHRFPSACIHAFEADPAIAETLSLNVASFGLSGVTVHHRAAWTHEGTVRFSASGDDAGHVAAEAAIGNEISTTRLRNFVEGRDVDLLKLDIEGSEFAVLQDCDGALAGVRSLIVEVHLFGQRDASLAKLLTVIERNGFQYALSDLCQPTWLPCPTPPPFHQLHTNLSLVTVFAWR